ncbi:hypothetical protein D9M72_644440 [compost metagenome]
MARVRDVIARSSATGSRHPVSGSTSVRTGIALIPSTADADATQLTPGTITSSCAPTSQASKAMLKLAVPVEDGTQYLAPV